MKKLKLMALAGVMMSSLGMGQVCAAAAGAGHLEQTPIDDKSEVYGRGMERIDKLCHRYASWSFDGHHYYPLFGIRHNLGIDKVYDVPGGPIKHMYAVHPQHFVFKHYSRSITGDIRDAFLDQTKFDLALMEDRYFEAWAMAEPNEQGELWKRMAAAGAKKKCKELGMESVLLEASDPTESRALAEKAGRIFTSFPAGGIRDELRRMYDDGVRLASPPVVTGASPAVRFDHALATERYFEAWNMGGESEEGRLRKEMAAAGAKKKCKELGMESILLESSDPTESRALAEKAGSIFTSFPEGNPLREELRAQFELGRRLATHPAPTVASELVFHRSIIARLLEE